MQKIIIILALTFFSIFTISKSFGQDYKTGIGIRVGTYNGLTIKYFSKPTLAWEFIIATRYRALGVTILVEGHTHFLGTPRLNFLYGVGGHTYFWGENNVVHSPFGKSAVVGLDGILGLEYAWANIPISMSIDWKPTLNLGVTNRFWVDESAFSIRYTF